MNPPFHDRAKVPAPIGQAGTVEPASASNLIPKLGFEDFNILVNESLPQLRTQQSSLNTISV